MLNESVCVYACTCVCVCVCVCAWMRRTQTSHLYHYLNFYFSAITTFINHTCIRRLPIDGRHVRFRFPKLLFYSLVCSVPL